MASQTIKTDCIMFKHTPNGACCAGLKRLYCLEGKCVFYKSNKQFNADGSPKKEGE